MIAISAIAPLIFTKQYLFRFTAAVNQSISKKIVSPNTLIGLENLKHIRQRITRKSSKKAHRPRRGFLGVRTEQEASLKQRKAKRNKSKWAFAQLHGYIDYKAILSSSLAVKVPA